MLRTTVFFATTCLGRRPPWVGWSFTANRLTVLSVPSDRSALKLQRATLAEADV